MFSHSSLKNILSAKHGIDFQQHASVTNDAGVAASSSSKLFTDSGILDVFHCFLLVTVSYNHTNLEQRAKLLFIHSLAQVHGLLHLHTWNSKPCPFLATTKYFGEFR